MSGMEPLYFPTLGRQDDATPPDPPTPPIPSKEDNPTPDDDLGAPDNGHPRKLRRYSPTERLGLCYLAVRDGTRPTARAFGVADSTLDEWLSQAGGLGQVRAWLLEQTRADLLRSARAIFDAIASRAEGMTVDELNRTYRHLTGLFMAPEAGAVPVGAQAAAQANVTVTIGDKDGQRVIDLGPPPEEDSG